MKLTSDWNDFWFKQIPSGPLGAFRIAFGCILVAWGLLLAPPDLYTWFSDQGLLPVVVNRAYGLGMGTLNWFTGLRDPHALLALYFVYLIGAVCLTIGFGTRVATVVTFICLLSLHNRDSVMLNGGDSLERLLLFYLMFAPSGASCSVDRMIAVARGKEAGEPPLIEAWPVRLMQLQVSAVYLSTVMSKSEGVLWQNGTALYYPLHLSQFYRFPLGPLPDLMWAINLGTFAALATEFSLATFVWVPRLRGYVLAAGTLLHLSIDYAMNIPLFSFLMISSYLNFVPNPWLSNWIGALSRSFTRYRLDVHYNPGSESARRAVAVLERMDAVRLLTFSPCDCAASDPTGLTVHGRGWSSSGPDALRRTLACLPALWPFIPVLLVPGSSRLLAPLVKAFSSAAPIPEPVSEATSSKPLVSSERG